MITIISTTILSLLLLLSLLILPESSPSLDIRTNGLFSILFLWFLFSFCFTGNSYMRDHNEKKAILPVLCWPSHIFAIYNVAIYFPYKPYFRLS